MDTPSLQASQSISDDVYSFGLSLSELSNAAVAAHSCQETSTIGNATEESSPHVFLPDGTHDEPAIMGIVQKFALNTAQERAFCIIAYHTLRSKVGPQLRMGVFGEGRTAKSRLIAAIHAWFAVLNRQNELMVTATTGTAAFNVVGTTLNSTANLPIGNYSNHTWA